MAQRPDHDGRRLNGLLARAQELAEQVRETAERVHQQARETHRLTGIARQQAERGRELSKAGREEARAVVDWPKWQLDLAGSGKPRQSRRDETAGHGVLAMTGTASATGDDLSAGNPDMDANGTTNPSRDVGYRGAYL